MARLPAGIVDNARWSTSVHEAAHVIAVRRFGGSASARLAGNGRTGSYSGTMPDRTGGVEDAVVDLAGGMGQRILVGRDGPSSSDISQARRSLRGTGVSFGQAQSRAAALVRSNRGAILRAAEQLYRNGTL